MSGDDLVGSVIRRAQKDTAALKERRAVLAAERKEQELLEKAFDDAPINVGKPGELQRLKHAKSILEKRQKDIAGNPEYTSDHTRNEERIQFFDEWIRKNEEHAKKSGRGGRRRHRNTRKAVRKSRKVRMSRKK